MRPFTAGCSSLIISWSSSASSEFAVRRIKVPEKVEPRRGNRGSWEATLPEMPKVALRHVGRSHVGVMLRSFLQHAVNHLVPAYRGKKSSAQWTSSRSDGSALSVDRRAGEWLEQCRANAQLAVERDRCLPDFTVTTRRAVGRKFSDVQAQLLDYEADARDFVFELPQEEVGVVVHVGSAVPACLKRNAAIQVSGAWHLLSRNAVELQWQI